MVSCVCQDSFKIRRAGGDCIYTVPDLIYPMNSIFGLSEHAVKRLHERSAYCGDAYDYISLPSVLLPYKGNISAFYVGRGNRKLCLSGYSVIGTEFNIVCYFPTIIVSRMIVATTALEPGYKNTPEYKSKMVGRMAVVGNELYEIVKHGRLIPVISHPNPNVRFLVNIAQFLDHE